MASSRSCMADGSNIRRMSPVRNESREENPGPRNSLEQQTDMVKSTAPPSTTAKTTSAPARSSSPSGHAASTSPGPRSRCCCCWSATFTPTTPAFAGERKPSS